MAIVTVLGFALHTNSIKLPITVNKHTQFIAEMADDRVKAGYADNMFVGKIMKQLGYIQTDDGAGTQFEVAVVVNIKGDFIDTITVTNHGGYKNGVLYRSELESDLTLGSTYLLITRFFDNQNWTFPVFDGSTLISEDTNLSIAELQAIAIKDERIVRMQDAYEHEIPDEELQEAYKNEDALNSFRLLYKLK